MLCSPWSRMALCGLVLVLSSCKSGNEWSAGPEPAEPVVETCVDEDGDGFGRGCALGADCDDNDPLASQDCAHCLAGPAEGCPCAGQPAQPCYSGPEATEGVGLCRAGLRACEGGVWQECSGEITPRFTEACDGEDDDCDGEVDEGATGECGTCDPYCLADAIGAAGDRPWEPREDNSEGVGIDEESGGLILDTDRINTFLIWVANTAEGTVSKIDVRTFEELGRYRTGSDPSRTSVNSLGDVYVGNRGGQSLTKVSALGDRCPDTNGDGIVTTSSGHDVLAEGQDDCVLWSTPLPGCGVIRAVAAQDEFGPDGEMHPYVWAGGWEGCLWLLDGETGEILVNATPAPVNPYGFAFDGDGNLWIENGGGLGRLDTRRCRDDTSCAVEVCGDDGDDCVKQRITQPVGGYGITVDFEQRVWIGGTVARYDPAQPLGARWTTVNPGEFVHGIAADAMGWVWGAAGGTVFRINADDPTQFVRVAGAAGYSAKGAAVDAEGKIWMINRSHNNATVITPGEGIDEATVATNVSPVFSNPYTYSDMTGLQMRFATQPRGHYREVFTGCDRGETEWGSLVYDAFVPTGTQVLFRVRTADDAAALEAAEWVVVATAPDDESPVSVDEALRAAAVPAGSLLELDVQLSSEVADGAAPLSPVVLDIAITRTCLPDLV